MKKQLPGWAVLLIITLVAGLALGGTNALTKDPIAQQALIKAENARKAALPDAETFDELTLNEGANVDWVYAGLKDGNPVGYVAQKTVNGFGGKVEVIAGVDTANAPDTFKIGGITVGGADFSETAGLGARAKEPAFTNQFPGKIYPISYIKAGGEATESTVDALTSATITTTAVVNGVNDIVKYVKADVMGIAGVEMPAKPDSGVFSSSEKGFRGPVYVEAAFDGAGKVTYIKVGDESFAEDIGVGVIEPDFMIQFIGKQMPLEVSDIDVIAGATISSTAVVKALNNAYAIAGGAEIVVPETPTMPEKPAEGVFSSAEKGFAGPVYVEAAFDEAGKITYLGVGDDQFAETEGFGARALTPEEQYPFIGAQMPLDIADVDTLTGATFTKTAIVNGLNKAYAASKGEVIEEPAEPEAPAEEAAPVSGSAVQANGLTGTFDVTVELNDDGTVKEVKLGESNSDNDKPFLALANTEAFLGQFVGKTLPVDGIDIATGATVSSNAIIEAVNSFAGKSAPAEEAAPAGDNTVQANGLTGAFDVTVELNDDGTVKEVKLGESNSDNDKSFLALANTEAFLGQFVGKTLPVDGIDVATGATVSSNAIIEAVNSFAGKSAPAEPEAEEQPAEPAGETETAATEYKLSASFDGGKLTALAVEPGDTEAAMQEKFLNAALPLNLDGLDGDALTVAVAINKAYDRYLAEQQPAAPAEEAPKEEPETSGSSSLALRVTAEFDGDTLTGLTVLEKAADGENFVPGAQEEALKGKFIGQSLPLDTGKASSVLEATAAIAINKAYYAAAHEAEPGQAEVIGGADEPTAILLTEQEEGEEAPYRGEAISFFTSIRVGMKIAPDGSLAVTYEDKPVGAEEYRPSKKSAELEARFAGKELPLNVADYDDPYTAAAAVAVNEALKQFYTSQEQAQEEETIVFGTFGEGESISFFMQYRVAAAFENGKLSTFGAFKAPLGGNGAVEAIDCARLNELLDGSEMPLAPDDDWTAAGLPEYEVTAIVVALNQAYVNSLAGLQ